MPQKGSRRTKAPRSTPDPPAMLPGGIAPLSSYEPTELGTKQHWSSSLTAEEQFEWFQKFHKSEAAEGHRAIVARAHTEDPQLPKKTIAEGKHGFYRIIRSKSFTDADSKVHHVSEAYEDIEGDALDFAHGPSYSRGLQKFYEKRALKWQEYVLNTSGVAWPPETYADLGRVAYGKRLQVEKPTEERLYLAGRYLMKSMQIGYSYELEQECVLELPYCLCFLGDMLPHNVVLSEWRSVSVPPECA